MIKICIVSVCDIAIPSRSTGWRPAPTRTVSYAGKLKHWSAPTSKSLNPFQLPALHVTEIITSLAHILISHLLLRDEFSVINDTCYVNGAVLIVWQVSAAAAALAAGGGGRKGPAVLQGDGHPDLHMPHGEHLLNQRSAVCVCVCVCEWEWALTEALLYVCRWWFCVFRCSWGVSTKAWVPVPPSPKQTFAERSPYRTRTPLQVCMLG